eukprot:10408162-Alexandrium_andersonii.AAC.1
MDSCQQGGAAGSSACSRPSSPSRSAASQTAAASSGLPGPDGLHFLLAGAQGLGASRPELGGQPMWTDGSSEGRWVSANS